jgi:prepilin-type N-terminal cleavage/methylation domain-containing protein
MLELGRQRPGQATAGRLGRPAFTLVELLIVVAIIGALTTMLVPSLLNARLLAKRASCQASLSAVGRAAAMYQYSYGDYVPICWANISDAYPHPWKSWRASLLPYTTVAAFNCPAATGDAGELFTCAMDITGTGMDFTINAGSYGVLYQDSLPSFQAVNCYGHMARGHPVWSQAFPTTPGAAWSDPANSIYVADCYLAKGPIAYPSPPGYKGYGSSAIVPPSAAEYQGSGVTRRFADRHCGTNALFLGGYVLTYSTTDLDNMAPGNNCVWSTE